MPCSPAQLAANRANALKSTGPKTQEGKERSRRNALKHGLTGKGIVMRPEDEVEVARRVEAMHDEIRPNSEAARFLIGRAAVLSVRMDRSAEQEAKHISHRMRHAVEVFDDARLAEVEHAYSWIATEPATYARRLRMSPEGIDRIVASMGRLKDDLGHPDGIRWGWQHDEHLHHLMGMRRLEVPVSRPRALSEAVGGDFQYLSKADGGDLAKGDRQSWAVNRLIELIDGEVAKLEALRGKLDLETLELDRSEAPARAMFDDSKPAVLARKYEASAERAYFRTMKDLRLIQEQSPEMAAEHEVGPEPAEELGPCFPAVPDGESEEADVDRSASAAFEDGPESRPGEGHVGFDGGDGGGFRGEGPQLRTA